MRLVLFTIYTLNIAWLFFSLVYCFIGTIKIQQGTWRNDFLRGWRMNTATILVAMWLFYVVCDARDSYYILEVLDCEFTQFSMVEKIIREAINLVTSVLVTMLITGFGIKDDELRR